MGKHFRAHRLFYLIVTTLFVATPLRPAWSVQCIPTTINVRTQRLNGAMVDLFNGGLDFTRGVCVQGNTLVLIDAYGMVCVYNFGPNGWELTQSWPVPVRTGYGRCMKLDGDVLVIEAPDQPNGPLGKGVVYAYLKNPNGFELLQIVDPPAVRERWSLRCAMDLDDGWLIIGEPNVVTQSDIDIFRYNPTTKKFDFKQTFTEGVNLGQGLHVSNGWATWQTIGSDGTGAIKCLRLNTNQEWAWAESNSSMRIPGDDGGANYSPIRFMDYGLAVDFQNRVWMFSGSTWQIMSNGLTSGQTEPQVYILNETHVLQGEVVYEWNSVTSSWLSIGSNECIFRLGEGGSSGDIVSVSGGWPNGHVIFCEKDRFTHTLALNTSPEPTPTTLPIVGLVNGFQSSYDFFGSAVDVSEDIVVVGAPGYSWGDFLSAGSATVFRRTGGNWVNEAVLKSPTPENYDRLGKEVLVSGKGANKVIAFSGEGYCLPNAINSKGSACAAIVVNNVWVVTELIPTPEPSCGDRYGDALAIFGDKQDAVIAVGAKQAVYIFRCNQGSFTYSTKLDCPLGSWGDLWFSDSNHLFAVRQSGANCPGANYHFSYNPSDSTWNSFCLANFIPYSLDMLGDIVVYRDNDSPGKIRLQLRDWGPMYGDIGIGTGLTGAVTAANLAWDQENHLLIGVTDGSSAKLIRMNCSRFEDESFQCPGFVDIAQPPIGSASIAVDCSSASPVLVAGTPFVQTQGEAFVWSDPNFSSSPGDANNDQKINGADVAIVIVSWGVVSPPTSRADFNHDGFVNAIDLQFVLSNWSQN